MRIRHDDGGLHQSSLSWPWHFTIVPFRRFVACHDSAFEDFYLSCSYSKESAARTVLVSSASSWAQRRAGAWRSVGSSDHRGHRSEERRVGEEGRSRRWPA